MRNPVLLVALIFSALGTISLGSSESKISQLPDGSLSGKIYTNDALGLRYEVPSGWVAAADPKGPVNLDYRRPDGPANQCSKVLLSLHAPQQSEGRFNSTATILTIDPSCFWGARFPKSLEDKNKILKFADKIIKAFSNTPYISRNGADVDAVREAGRLIIQLTGGDVINAVEGRDQATKEPLHVNTLFCLTESNGYWVAWTFFGDDSSKEELKNANVQFKVAP
jgi:hypothetical protein